MFKILIKIYINCGYLKTLRATGDSLYHVSFFYNVIKQILFYRLQYLNFSLRNLFFETGHVHHSTRTQGHLHRSTCTCKDGSAHKHTKIKRWDHKSYKLHSREEKEMNKSQ